jgi:hypothetical protein
MTGDRVQIDSLQLNIPGLARDEAEHLKREMARCMELYLPISMPKRKIESLNLQVSISDATPKNQLAEMIAKQICKSLS